MIYSPRYRLLFEAGLQASLILVLAGFGLLLTIRESAAQHASHTIPPASTAALDRDIEPVVLSDIFPNVPVEQIFVYRYTDDNGWEPIAAQVDERSSEGLYVTREDGTMDANDEVVFMSGELGEEATAPISSSLTISESLWYEVEVTDPLSEEKAWAYVVRSTELNPTPPAAYISGYEEGDQVLTARDYAVGWAEDFGGLDYLSPFGGEDILDRTKLWGTAEVGGVSFSVNEDDVESQEVVADKVGSVRAILRVDSELGTATTTAYGSMLNTTTEIDLSAYNIPDTLRVDVGISTDLLPSAAPGSYYDENTASGVTIDGNPDEVPTGLTDSWRQVSLDSGTVIQVVDFGDLAGTRQHYYEDNDAVDEEDTGDGQAIGDSGFTVENVSGRVFLIESIQFMLSGSQENRGATFHAYTQRPLAVQVTPVAQAAPPIDADNALYLPVVLK